MGRERRTTLADEAESAHEFTRPEAAGDSGCQAGARRAIAVQLQAAHKRSVGVSQAAGDRSEDDAARHKEFPRPANLPIQTPPILIYLIKPPFLGHHKRPERFRTDLNLSICLI